MKCENCKKAAVHIFADANGEHCEHCSGISVMSAVKTDGILTRNSWRIRRGQSRHEGDMVMPHIYDKTAHRQKINPDFVKLYPDKVKDFFNEEEMKRDGYSKMPDAVEKNNHRREKQKAIEKMDTVFDGDGKAAVEKFLSQPA